MANYSAYSQCEELLEAALEEIQNQFDLIKARLREPAWVAKTPEYDQAWAQILALQDRIFQAKVISQIMRIDRKFGKQSLRRIQKYRTRRQDITKPRLTADEIKDIIAHWLQYSLPLQPQGAIWEAYPPPASTGEKGKSCQRQS